MCVCMVCGDETFGWPDWVNDMDAMRLSHSLVLRRVHPPLLVPGWNRGLESRVYADLGRAFGRARTNLGRTAGLET